MTDTFDAVLAEIQQPETLRLHMGEMTPCEVMIAQAAVRFAHSRLAAAHAAEVAERDAMLREVEVTLENCAAHMTTLRARAEAVERDARRYRWLRNARCGSGSGEVEILIWRGELGVIANDADRDLNAVIDAAIATTEDAP